jgi:hypothetical protein
MAIDEEEMQRLVDQSAAMAEKMLIQMEPSVIGAAKLSATATDTFYHRLVELGWSSEDAKQSAINFIVSMGHKS